MPRCAYGLSQLYHDEMDIHICMYINAQGFPLGGNFQNSEASFVEMSVFGGYVSDVDILSSPYDHNRAAI